jgi:uncharacterized protein (DUF2461 family)
LLEPKQCVFRINRDVRFSKNKDPIKTIWVHTLQWVVKNNQVQDITFCQPNESFIGGGIWMPMADELKRIRQEIDYNYTEFNGIVFDYKI